MTAETGTLPGGTGGTSSGDRNGAFSRLLGPTVSEGMDGSWSRWAQALLAGLGLAWLVFQVPGVVPDTGPASPVGGDPFAVQSPGDAGALTQWAWALFFLALPLLAIVDAQIHKIPDRVLKPVTAAVVVLMGLDAVVGRMNLYTALSALTGAAIMGAYAFTLWYVAPERGYGWGDVKLTAACGLVLGSQSVWAAVVGLAIIPPLLGLLPMLLAAARARDGHAAAVPFGPFLLLGVVLAAFLGPVYFPSPI